MAFKTFEIKNGSPKPFGASQTREGVNFSLYSKHATNASLCLFEYPSRKPLTEIALDPIKNRTGDVWHVLIKDLNECVFYAYRLSKKKGRIFCQFYQEDNLILDPYATAVDSRKNWGDFKTSYQPLGIFNPKEDFDWEEDEPLQIPLKDLIIYEMHVRGFTCHESSRVVNKGTFKGIIEKIPHFIELGINCVKLMPIQEFNECEYTKYNPDTGAKLLNYWGYSTVNFFSPMSRYASESAVTEFKSLVKELHKNGIEVILDVVFNHTAEGNLFGPIYSFKGIDPSVYYILDKKENHVNYTGCGNTVNCNHPIVRKFILNCLQYWVSEMHVDGFRFDLAAIMARGMQGELLENPPLIEELSQDPVLARTKLIAEPWDSAGLYQLGKFYPKQERWSEWNDKYRDSIRKFIKGDKGAKKEFAGRICGSEDIFYGRSPNSSINFVIAHDGFTLRDLVSYNEKHNSSNGEDNRDGTSANYSWNCGAEGFSTSSDTEHLREKQMRNFHLALMVSQGVPMLHMGDEYTHSRNGNNNSWCQDNSLSWFLWDRLNQHPDFFRFYKELIHFRKRHELFRLGRFVKPEDIEWHGSKAYDPDWDGPSQTLAFVLKDENEAFYIAFNPESQNITFELPPSPFSANWSLLVNTAALAPHDFYSENEGPSQTTHIELENYSAIVLYSCIIKKQDGHDRLHRQDQQG